MRTVITIDDADDGRLILLHLCHSFVRRVRPQHVLRRCSLISVHPIRCSTHIIIVITAINTTTTWSLLLLDAILMIGQIRLPG